MNSIYKAFREFGRVIRTIQLLRQISDSLLRTRITAAVNKAETYNGCTKWLRFGNLGVIADNHPAEQEKILKLNSLLANCVIFHTALDMTNVIRELQADGVASRSRTSRSSRRPSPKPSNASATTPPMN
jgi:TnpA family transposase